MGVAVHSRFEAAYALGRPGVASTLAGVAIAAALVPPLCVVGIGLTNGQPLVAANSAILLTTNLVAIILSAAFAFALLGIRGVSAEGRFPAWVRRASIVLVLIAVILLLPLLVNVKMKKRRGQNKPLTYPVAAHVQEAVEEYIDAVPDLALLMMARVSVEPASDLSILLTTTGTPPTDVVDDLTRLVYEVRGGKPRVRVVILREVQPGLPVPTR